MEFSKLDFSVREALADHNLTCSFTLAGEKVNFVRPEAEASPCLVSIAQGLSVMPRFCGHTSKFYSVAEHSINVAAIAVRIAQDEGFEEGEIGVIEQLALFHDATEAFMSDVPKPLKDIISDGAGEDSPSYKDIEERLANVIFLEHTRVSDYGYVRVDSFMRVVKLADQIAFLHECRDLRNGEDHWFLSRAKLIPIDDPLDIRSIFIHAVAEAKNRE